MQAVFMQTFRKPYALFVFFLNIQWVDKYGKNMKLTKMFCYMTRKTVCMTFRKKLKYSKNAEL